jgi:hypothetical protein
LTPDLSVPTAWPDPAIIKLVDAATQTNRPPPLHYTAGEAVLKSTEGEKTNNKSNISHEERLKETERTDCFYGSVMSFFLFLCLFFV